MKTSPFVKKQIPRIFEESGSRLGQFLQKYYEWSEQAGHPISDIKSLLDNTDIDKTEEKFIDFFMAEFAPSLDVGMAADKRLLLKHVIDFYKARGTERAYSFLFNIIYQDVVDIRYPADSVFMTSSATWVQERSVFITSATPIEQQDFELAYFMVGTRRVSIRATKIRFVKTGVYELFFTTTKQIPARIDKVVLDDVQYSPLLTMKRIKIESRGTDFLAGEIYDIPTAVGQNVRIKVVDVDQNGGITSLQIIRFGFGFLEQPLKISLFAKAGLVMSPSIEISGDNTQAFDGDSNVEQVEDYGEISLAGDYGDPNYFFEQSYNGALLTTFLDYTQTNFSNSEPAILSIEPSSTTLYEGFHSDIIGFTSDASPIFDGEFIQNYSYIISSSKNFEDYYSIVKQVLHPAGFSMFGERYIVTSTNLEFSSESYVTTG